MNGFPMASWWHNAMKLFLKLYSTMLLLIFHKIIVYHYFNHQVHSFISWCIFKIKMKMLTNESRHFFFINDLETRFACFFLNAFKIRGCDAVCLDPRISGPQLPVPMDKWSPPKLVPLDKWSPTNSIPNQFGSLTSGNQTSGPCTSGARNTYSTFHSNYL